jgi:hypothetical protein
MKKLSEISNRFTKITSENKLAHDDFAILGFIGNFRVTATRGVGWDHVSVSLNDRCPTWEEMCKIKDIFFNDEELAIQYHPKKSEYVNSMDYCLHLWKAHDIDFPRPNPCLIGFTKNYEIDCANIKRFWASWLSGKRADA